MVNFDEISRLLDNSLESKQQCLKSLLDASLFLVSNHKQSDRNNHADQDAFILFQMCSVRCISVLELSDGIELKSEINNGRLALLDPISVFNLVRGVFEAYCNFSNIYIQSKSVHEIRLKYDLWVLSGLKYRQRGHATMQEHLDKKEKEEKLIDIITNEIKANPLFTELSETSRSKILKAMQNRKWHLHIDGDKAFETHWQDIFKREYSDVHFDNFYSQLSLNTHPSNVSVFQFAQLYELNQDISTMALALRMTMILLSFFIQDYVQYFPCLNSYKQQLPSNTQFQLAMINGMRAIKKNN